MNEHLSPSKRFVLDLGRAMHAFGSPAYRVEDAMDACAQALSLHGAFFATPTAIFASLSETWTVGSESVLLRVRPGTHDLGKLTDLYAVRDQVVLGNTTAAAGIERLAAVLQAPPTWGTAAVLPAFAVASASASVFLGGGPGEFAVAAAAGACIGLAQVAQVAAGARVRLVGAFECFACALAALLVHAAASMFAVQPVIALIASVIVLLPGLSFTTALAELSMQHLAAGSARLLGAFATLLTMAIGVGVGFRTGALLCGPAQAVAPTAWPSWIVPIALVLAAWSFGILLRAKPRQLPWVVVAVAVGHGGAALGALWLGPELGASLGAAFVAVAANLWARWQRQPAAVLATPGLLMLVPGALGFRGLTGVVEQDLGGGAHVIVQMLLVGGALVAGLLVAGTLVPPPLDAAGRPGEGI